MKKLATALIAIGGLLSGCVAYDYPNRDGGTYYRDGAYYRDGGTYYRDGGTYDRDRDRDGVSNRQDRYPDDARRY